MWIKKRRIQISINLAIVVNILFGYSANVFPQDQTINELLIKSLESIGELKQLNLQLRDRVSEIETIAESLASRDNNATEYCGSIGSHDGNVGGFAAISNLCENACGGKSGSRICTSHDIVVLAVQAKITKANGWFATGVMSRDTLGLIDGGDDRANSPSDCSSFRSNHRSDMGMVWSGTSFSWGHCNSPKPIMCCR